MKANLKQVLKDAGDLGECYLTLKVIMGKLEELSERYDIKELRNLLQDDIKTLDKIDHDLPKIAKALRDNVLKK